MGMPSEEFWHGRPALVKAYRKAMDERRAEAYRSEWRQGIYVMEALLSASAAFREFSRGIEHEYPEQPLFSTEHDKEAAEEARDKRKMERMKALFGARVAKVNMRFEKASEGNDDVDGSDD